MFSHLHRAGLTPFSMEVFRCGKPLLFLGSSLKIYGTGCPSGQEQKLQESPMGETKRMITRWKGFRKTKTNFVAVLETRFSCHQMDTDNSVTNTR